MFALTSVAEADSVWTYTGNSQGGALSDPNPCNCALTGSVTFDSSWNVLSYDFTDGTHELTQADSTGVINPFFMTGTIPFAEWHVALDGGGVRFLTENFGSVGEATDSVLVDTDLFLLEEGNRGVWSGPVSTAEPATGLLVGLGLAVVGLMRRRRKKLVDPVVWEKLG